MAVKKDPRMTDPLAGDGPGAYLRKAREEANMSVDKVATALLLHSHTVELLEADAYASLPAPTFVRGYLRGYARVLGLPSGPVLDMYDRQGFEPPPLTTEVNESTQAHTSDTAVRIVTYAVAVVLVLLVGLWWHSQEDGGFGVAGDLAGDLFERSPDAGEDPSLPATEESGTAPDDGDAEGGSVAMASGSADEFARDGEFPAPAPGSDAEFGELASDGTATAGTEAEGESGTLPGTSPGTSPGTLPGDEAPTATSTVADTTPGEVVTDEFRRAGAEANGEATATGTTTAGAEAGGETIAMAPTRPSATPGGEGSAVPAPVEEAVAPGDIVEVAPSSAETSAPDATTDGEASAAQEPPPEADAGDSRTAGADAGPVAGTDPGGAGDENAPAPEASAGTDAADASVSASLATVPVPETAGAALGATANATAGTGTGQSGLVLEFVHESWVEVYDGERTRLFFGLVQPGRVLTFDGPRPYDILLGFGKDVRVAIDGQAFDHTPYLKHGVARFSVVGTGPGNGAAGAG